MLVACGALILCLRPKLLHIVHIMCRTEIPLPFASGRGIKTFDLLNVNQQVLAQFISCCTLLREHLLTIGSFSLRVENRGLIFVIVGKLCRIVRIKRLGLRPQDFALRP